MYLIKCNKIDSIRGMDEFRFLHNSKVQKTMITSFKNGFKISGVKMKSISNRTK